jgi:cytochrome P450
MTTQHDWAQDYNVFDTEYAADPYPIWDELRHACPVAHTERYGGSWLTTTYADVTRVARDPGTFSSRNVGVIPPPDGSEAELLPAGLPPIQADPPVHTWTRRLLLPWFSKDGVAAYEGYTRELCRTLLDGFAESGRVDAAADSAKQVPVRVIGKMLGVPAEMSDTFIEWVRGVLEFANDAQLRGCPVKEGDRVVLNFAAANRDPAAFPDADQVIIDRAINRHVAFGAGIHRCAGSNLARMELLVALEEWLARMPTFRLEEGGDVTWAGGQVRSPRHVPVVFP